MVRHKLAALLIVFATLPIAHVHASTETHDIYDHEISWIDEVHKQKEYVNLTEEELLAEIEKQVDFASEAIGVRKDFLMGMLVVESDLGRNTGGCTYQEVMDGAERAHKNGRLSERSWQTFLKRKKIIKKVATDAGRDYRAVKVSCNPPYAGTGGAMGIPQFMPDTWMEYKDRIAEMSGSENPDPWNVRDGVVAMALKVSDVPGVTNHNVWAERKASKLYLSGTTLGKYEWYASRIQYWSRNYETLIG